MVAWKWLLMRLRGVLERVILGPWGSNDMARILSSNWWVAAFTGALVIATFGLVIVGSLQWLAMRHQEHWMRENVRIANVSANAAKAGGAHF